MSNQETSHLWFRVANLKPQLRDHVTVHRQEFREQIWYVYQDRSTNRYHRFNETVHHFIGLMDGERTVQAIWEIQKQQHQTDAPDQEDVIRLLGQLHGNDLLQSNVQPDTLELYERAKKQQQKRWKGFVRNPVSVRVPLFDPEQFLTRSMPFISGLFTRTGFVIWSVLMALSAVLALSYWPELSEHASTQLMLPKNLLLLGILYPLIKLVHEFGHAFAVRHWRGEVHEMGVIFIMLLPIPYVDASAASVFRHKYQRIAVGAMGIMAELFLASMALIIWLNVEPGLVSNIAFNIMLIGGVSTLFFNGNPLLRYDGYYMLADAIAIPNLASRSNKYIGYLIQRYLFRFDNIESPADSVEESAWFACYAPGAFVYRMTVLSVIIMLIADQSFTAGLILGCWILLQQVLLPLVRQMQSVITSPRQRQHRKRTIAISSALVTGIALVLLTAPFPNATIAQGVIWSPENNRVHATSSGFVTKVVATPGSMLSLGDVILELEDPLLQARIKVLQAQLQELTARYNAAWSSRRVESKNIREDITALQADLDQTLEKERNLVVRVATSGKLIMPHAQDLPGRFLKQGDFIAYLADITMVKARIVIPQEDMSLLSNTKTIDIMLAGNTREHIRTTLGRIFPEATYRLPSAVLGSMGGGELAINPLDESGLQSLEKIMQIELGIDVPHATAFIGKRVFVRFDHGSATLAQQWHRSLQQLLLRRFSV